MSEKNDHMEDNLGYNGSNKAGKLFLQKLLKHDEERFRWDSISKNLGQPLLDYTMLGCGTKYKYHYNIPILNSNSNKIEYYLIYQIDVGDLNYPNLRGDIGKPIIMDEVTLQRIPIEERFIYSMFFFKWHKKGLQIKKELYHFAEELNDNFIPIGAINPQTRSINSFVTYKCNILYWLDLDGYLPPTADAYEISLQTRRQIFENHTYIFSPKADLTLKVKLESVELEVLTPTNYSNGKFRTVVQQYLNLCALDFKALEGSPGFIYQFTYISGDNTGGGTGGSSGSGGGSSESGNSFGEKYDIKEDDILAKKGIATKMSEQLPNTCVTAIMQYVAKEFFGKDINEGVYIIDYLKKYKENILYSGVDVHRMQGFVKMHFQTSRFSDFKSAIDDGHAVMTDIKSNIPNSGHNVLVVGYTSNGNLIYMDSEKGFLCEGNKELFNLNYAINIINCR